MKRWIKRGLLACVAGFLVTRADNTVAKAGVRVHFR